MFHGDINEMNNTKNDDANEAFFSLSEFVCN